MQVAALRNGEIDVGLLRPIVDTAGLAVMVLREEQVVLLLPETHPLAQRKRIPLRVLAGCCVRHGRVERCREDT